MADPFRSTPTTASGLGRALRSKRATAFEALENLLACAERIRAVRAEEVRDVCAAAAVDLERKYLSDRKDLYRRYLMHCLEDKVLSEEESQDLRHLAALLHLGEADVEPIHDELARDVYGKAIAEVLDDMRLDPEEEAFLRRLRGELRIPEEVARRIHERGEDEARARAFSRASQGDAELVAHRVPAGEFTGRSEDSLEAAIADALAQATLAVPKLYWFEVERISGYVEDGAPSGWLVTLSAGIRPER